MGALREPQSIDASPALGESERRARELRRRGFAVSAATPGLTPDISRNRKSQETFNEEP
jgi:hypothetical protein